MIKKITFILVSLILLTSVVIMASTERVELTGSIKSNKYHLSICDYANKIDKRYKVNFNNPQEAIKRGYVPCKKCRPPVK